MQEVGRGSKDRIFKLILGIVIKLHRISFPFPLSEPYHISLQVSSKFMASMFIHFYYVCVGGIKYVNPTCSVCTVSLCVCAFGVD